MCVTSKNLYAFIIVIFKDIFLSYKAVLKKHWIVVIKNFLKKKDFQIRCFMKHIFEPWFSLVTRRVFS